MESSPPTLYPDANHVRVVWRGAYGELAKSSPSSAAGAAMSQVAKNHSSRRVGFKLTAADPTSLQVIFAT